MGAFDLQHPDGAGFGGYLDPIGRELSAFALEAGVLLRPLGNVVYTLPPYDITDEQLGRVYDVIAEFLGQLDGRRTPVSAIAGATA
jgi:adenosylmethionine-8-amino-7-oxononanoate aminotransferase